MLSCNVITRFTAACPVTSGGRRVWHGPWADSGLPVGESHGSELETHATAEGGAPLVGQGGYTSRKTLENSV